MTKSKKRAETLCSIAISIVILIAVAYAFKRTADQINTLQEFANERAQMYDELLQLQNKLDALGEAIDADADTDTDN